MSPAAQQEPRVGASANNGIAYVLDSAGDSCYGKDQDGRDIPLQTDFSTSPTKFDTPTLAAVGHGAFGNLGGTSPSFLTPAAGLMRALDLVLPEYQRGQDFVGAWNVEAGGQFSPGYPSPVNDLQFLTGPAVADVDGLPGEEVIGGTSSKDFFALTGAGGVPVNDRWPKVTTDWTVANPLIGSFGTLDTAGSARKVAVNFTRSGYVNAYETDAPACSPSSWPRFHHDNANSGDYRRDAVLPGKPTEIATQPPAPSPSPPPATTSSAAPPTGYEYVTSPAPIDESNFGQATPLANAADPAEPGATETFTVPAGPQRYVAVRAVDEQGNVGRVASIDFLGPPPPPPPDARRGRRSRRRRRVPRRGGAAANGGCPVDPPPEDSDGDGVTDDVDQCDDQPGPATNFGCPVIPPPGACENRINGGPGRIGWRGPPRRPHQGSRRRRHAQGRAGDDCLAGGRGSDRLAAGAGGDFANGGKGADRISGGDGSDQLRSGRGHDRVSGGPGDDLVRVAGGGRDDVRCGPGDDIVLSGDEDRLRGCEETRD